MEQPYGEDKQRTLTLKFLRTIQDQALGRMLHKEPTAEEEPTSTQ